MDKNPTTYSKQDQLQAASEFNAADAAWQVQLKKTFGCGACHARHEPRGKGMPGTVLGDAYLARQSAYADWLMSRNLPFAA
jgi:hypothetical protein